MSHISNMNATISRESPVGGCVERLVGRCRNCGGWKRNSKNWYCDDCRVSMNIPKKLWVQPNSAIQPNPKKKD